MSKEWRNDEWRVGNVSRVPLLLMGQQNKESEKRFENVVEKKMVDHWNKKFSLRVFARDFFEQNNLNTVPIETLARIYSIVFEMYFIFNALNYVRNVFHVLHFQCIPITLYLKCISYSMHVLHFVLNIFQIIFEMYLMKFHFQCITLRLKYILNYI